MTLEEIKDIKEETITPAIAAKIIGCTDQSIRTAVKQERYSVNFPTFTLRNRVYIPRRPFIRLMDTGEPWFSRYSPDRDLIRQIVREELKKLIGEQDFG